MVVLTNADHMHFCDRAEEIHELFRADAAAGRVRGRRAERPPFSELVSPAQHGELFIRGLGLAHLDAVLRGDAAAKALLDDRGVGDVMACTGVCLGGP